MGIKNIIINRPKIYLGETKYLNYIVLLSRILWVLNLTYYIKVLKLNSESDSSKFIYEIRGLPFAIRIQSKYRVSRFIKGFEHAGKRQWDRYLIDFITDKEIPDVIIDIGANIGELSYYAHIIGIKQIYSIEPDPVVNEILAFNLRNTDAIVDNRALGLNGGFTNLYLNTDTADSSLFNSGKYSKIVKVKSVTLDDFFIENHLKGNVLLKMDAEGFEAEILSKGTHALKKIKYVSIDAGPERGGQETVDSVITILKENNFQNIFVINNQVCANRIEQ